MSETQKRHRRHASPSTRSVPVAQALASVVVLSVITLVLYQRRGEAMGTEQFFTWIPLNLGLAWVPYALSVAAGTWVRLRPRNLWPVLPLGAVWLVYYPNAAYLVTDIMNVRKYPASVPWYDMLLVSTLALTGVLLAIASLRTFHAIAESAWGRAAGMVFAAGVVYVAAVGVYIGRFLRWNSWDVIAHASEILKWDSANGSVLQRPSPLLFVTVFGTVQLALYLAFASKRVE